MINKKTLVIGGSTNSHRFSYKAIRKLRSYGYEVVSIGGREGMVDNVQIIKGKAEFESIHTITMYIGARHQPPMYEYILGLKPKRIIFNPGTENQELEKLAVEKGIEIVISCTLVMLNEGMY